MRIDEVVKLNTILKGDQYIKLLRRLKTRSLTDINVHRIKNRVIQSWKKGLKTHVHINSLLAEIDTNVDTLLQEED